MAKRHMQGQLSLGIFELEPKPEPKRNPLICEHWHKPFYEGSLNCCTKTGDIVVTGCDRSLCGEPPHCVYEPKDNSPEARARRVQWMKEHGDDDE